MSSQGADVAPNRLLLPGTARDTKIELVPEAEATEHTAWRWATGEAQFPLDLWTDDPAAVDLVRATRFGDENRPHDRSGQRTLDDFEEHEGALAPAVRVCREAVEKSGLSKLASQTWSSPP